MSKPDIIHVVIGMGADNKPHAAKYKDADEQPVEKAAGLMGYRLARAVHPKAKAIAKNLPEIKLFASGRALVPRVKEAVFGHLNEVLTFKAQQPSKELARNDEDASLDGLVPNPWAGIQAGSIVLAEEPTDGGWYEAEVLTVTSKGRTLSLRWRDWPKNKPFSAQRISVAIPPSARPAVVSPAIQTTEALAAPATAAADDQS